MSMLQLIVNESTRKLSNRISNQVFVVNDANVDTIRFSIPAGFSDIDIDENASVRVMYIPPGIDKTVYAKTLTFVQNDGVYISYDWQVGPNVLVESGILTVSFCILKTGSEVQEWHTIPYTIPVSNTIHTDDSDEADETITPTVAQRVAVLESMIQRVASGAPIVVASTSAMTDTEQIYVLSTNGNWYYHNGSAWVAGGEYGAVSTDTTLTQSGIPADAKAVGANLESMDSELTQGNIDLRISFGANLFNPYELKKGIFLNGTTGEEMPDSHYDASDYIAVGGTYTVKVFEYSGSGSRIRIYRYNADKTFYNRMVQPMDAYTFTWTGYIRINIDNSSNAYENPYKYMLVSGSNVPSEFVPYYTANDRTARNILMNNAVLTRGTGYDVTDANDLDDNAIYYTSPNHITENYPAGLGSAYIVTIPLNSTNKLQLAYNAYGTAVYIRACVNGTWGAWRDLAYAEKTIVNHLSTYDFTDLNAIDDNSIYYTSSSRVTDNYPPNLGAAYIGTVKLNTQNKMQMAFSAYGTAVYIRACVKGTWGAWKEFTMGGSSASYVTKAEAYETSTIALFPSVGCCGDSFTAGYLYNKTDSQWYDPNYVPNGEYPKIAYPAVMGRLYGIEVTPYAQGGLTSTGYRTASKALPALLNDDPKYLYIIALGLNDKTQNIPIGVEADIDTEPSTPSYLGNLGYIIRAIQNHAPYARIILCKSLWMATTYYDYISEGVELLSSHLGIPYIETKGDPFFESPQYKNGLKGLHPTAPLYAGIGKRIGELVGKCVIDNPEYFYNFYVPNE